MVRQVGARLGMNQSVYVPSATEITDMQRRFIGEYLIDLDQKQAAVRAGYPPDKAARAAAAIMRHGPVKNEIAKAMAERSKRVGINADRVLQRLGTIINGDPRAIFNEDGQLRKPHEMNADDALMLAGYKTRRMLTTDEKGDVVREEITEIKTVDMLSALNMGMKHLGMLNEKFDINVTSLADRLREAQLRRAGLLTDDGKVIDGTFSEVRPDSGEHEPDDTALLALEFDDSDPPASLEDLMS